MKSEEIDINELVSQCQKGNPKFQKVWYNMFAPRMLAVCRRYFQSEDEAEDAMIEGMFHAYKNLQQFEGKGSFEGWMRMVMVRHCLMIIRKNHLSKQNTSSLEIMIQEGSVAPDVSGYDFEIILRLLDELPLGYRTVFNLYVMEDLSHKEIAEMMGISIHTSKSQLIMARAKLQKAVEKLGIKRNII
jgi:RNA polymerase sigma factor (sigma-70 family)